MTQKSFRIKRGDTSPIFKYRLLDNNGQSIDLSGSSVKIIIRNKRGKKIVEDDDSGNVSISDAENGEVLYQWQPSDTMNAGEFKAEWEVTYPDSLVETFPNNKNIQIKIMDDLK